MRLFSPGKNWETIRTTIIYNQSNVKIAGHHAGIVTGPDGATHQATEDIAIVRVWPGITIFVPCDAIEAKKATIKAAEIEGPVYLRFTRDKTPVITTADTPFENKVQVFWESDPSAGSGPQAVILQPVIFFTMPFWRRKNSTLRNRSVSCKCLYN